MIFATFNAGGVSFWDNPIDKAIIIIKMDFIKVDNRKFNEKFFILYKKNLILWESHLNVKYLCFIFTSKITIKHNIELISIPKPIPKVVKSLFQLITTPIIGIKIKFSMNSKNNKSIAYHFFSWYANIIFK